MKIEIDVRFANVCDTLNHSKNHMYFGAFIDHVVDFDAAAYV